MVTVSPDERTVRSVRVASVVVMSIVPLPAPVVPTVRSATSVSSVWPAPRSVPAETTAVSANKSGVEPAPPSMLPVAARLVLAAENPSTTRSPAKSTLMSVGAA